MSFNIDVNLSGTGTAQASINQTAGEIKKLDEEMAERRTRIMAAWSFFNQISSMALSNLAGISKDQRFISAIQTAQFVQSKVMGEIAVVQTGLQALAAFGTGNIAGGTLLTILSLGLQATILASISAEIKSRQTEALSERLMQQIESYRS